LSRPSAYPEPTASVSLLQTHISYLFLTDEHVYKVKKAVDLGFLDFSTLDRRRFFCDEEVRLNRRLCPDLYLGVVEVKESPTGATFTGTGNVIDYAVKMKRLPAERMLDTLLAAGEVTDNDMRRIARTIARFHLEAERGAEIDIYGGMDCIRHNWEENFPQIEAVLGTGPLSEDLRLIREWGVAFLESHADLFARRVGEGRIRDCDGDIHLENICLADRIYIFDCLEFNNRFRYSDVAADIAFLLMDLDFHRQGPMGKAFLDEYIAATGDRGATGVLDYYKMYRAVVRGKVESIRQRDPQIPADERSEAREKAFRYFRLAKGYVLRNRLPRSLVITCGLPGTGKSTLAAELAYDLGVATLSSDRVRKELAGIAPDTRVPVAYGEGIYSAAASEATYRELLARADAVLGAGASVLVDASFRRKCDRVLFHALAKRHGVPMFVVRTTCPEDLIEQRLGHRAERPGEVSDGRWDLFHRQQAEFEMPGPNEGIPIDVDTSRPIADCLAVVFRELGVL